MTSLRHCDAICNNCHSSFREFAFNCEVHFISTNPEFVFCFQQNIIYTARVMPKRSCTSHDVGTVEVGTDFIKDLTDQVKFMAKELQEAKAVIEENKDLSVKVHKLQRRVESQALNSSSSFDWKHKGNRLQYEYNLNVVNQLTEASTSAELEDWDEVKQHLKSGIKGLFERNKLIKLVDKSESGWVFAEEYLDNELAENEEDARKI